MNRPPGRSTRANSPIGTAISGKSFSRWFASTTSKDSAANGRSSALASLKDVPGTMAASAALTCSPDMSMPFTWWAPRLASSRAMYPSPHPASSMSGSVSSVRYLSLCSRMMRSQNPALASQGSCADAGSGRASVNRCSFNLAQGALAQCTEAGITSPAETVDQSCLEFGEGKPERAVARQRQGHVHGQQIVYVRIGVRTYFTDDLLSCVPQQQGTRQAERRVRPGVPRIGRERPLLNDMEHRRPAGGLLVTHCGVKVISVDEDAHDAAAQAHGLLAAFHAGSGHASGSRSDVVNESRLGKDRVEGVAWPPQTGR